MTSTILRESAKMAFSTLGKNKLRSALTILGVTVGVVTILAMVSIIQGLNRSFSDQIESLGSNTLFIAKFDPSFGKPPGQEERQERDDDPDAPKALRARAARPPAERAVAPRGGPGAGVEDHVTTCGTG